MSVERDLLLDYVMGALTPEQEREVASYLREHPEDAAWVRDMFEAVAAVALTQDPADVPADAEDALLARIRRKASGEVNAETTAENVTPPNVVTLPKRPQRNRWISLGLAAAIAVIAYLSLRPQGDPVAQQLARICAESGVSCETLISDTDTPLGTLAERSDNSLFVVLSEDPPEGQVYQAWEIAGDTPRSLGTWTGRVLDIEEPVASGSAFGISVEPPGGSPQPTSTPIVVVPLS